MGDPAHEAHRDSNSDLRAALIKARHAEHAAGLARKEAYATHCANPEDGELEAAWHATQEEHVAAHEAVNRAAREWADHITGTTPERQESAMHTVDIDVETTGLEPDRHQVWEIGAIVEGHFDSEMDGEWWWQIRPSLRSADETAMRINHFYKRQQLSQNGAEHDAVELAAGSVLDVPAPTQPAKVAGRLAVLLTGATMFAAVPHMEASFLRPFLHAHGQIPTWHHRIRCYESMAEGHLGRYIGGLRDCADALGITYEPADLHTALGDAHLGRKIREHVWDSQG